MNPWARWGKFNMVGAAGMVVQLSTLALFNRMMEGHYLFASAVAIELTLMHNFVEHLYFTWRDRRERSALFTQFIRFHLSNGLVSMLGNLLLMRVLVEGARLPLLAANGIAILCCSLLNFYLGHNWAFAERAPTLRGYSKPALIYPGSNGLKSTRPTGSGDLARCRSGHSGAGLL